MYIRPRAKFKYPPWGSNHNFRVRLLQIWRTGSYSVQCTRISKENIRIFWISTWLRIFIENICIFFNCNWLRIFIESIFWTGSWLHILWEDISTFWYFIGHGRYCRSSRYNCYTSGYSYLYRRPAELLYRSGSYWLWSSLEYTGYAHYYTGSRTSEIRQSAVASRDFGHR